MKLLQRDVICGHCLKELSKTRFFQHRRLFYNKKAKEWSQQRVFETRLGDDFHFSDSEVDSKLHRVRGHLGIYMLAGHAACQHSVRNLSVRLKCSPPQINTFQKQFPSPVVCTGDKSSSKLGCRLTAQSLAASPSVNRLNCPRYCKFAVNMSMSCDMTRT